MNKPIRVSIVGASGYTGFELVKILLRHPQVKIAKLAVHQNPGAIFSNLYPSLKGLCDVTCSPIETASICAESDVVFFGLPHTTGMALMPDFLATGKKIIDLSADYRLNTPAAFKAAYGLDHCDAAHLTDFIYGLPEINRSKIKTAQAVANPGCFPTGIQLALVPAIKAGLIAPNMIFVDSKTGISGGGKTPKPAFHYPECNENVSAYKIASHQHEPEIEQELTKVAGQAVDIVFVPHLTPLTRGIFSTIYTQLIRPVSEAEIRQIYNDFYRNEPFVRITESDFQPQIKNVAYTNFCDIGLKVVGNCLILLSAIDNLIKGASGQAVQNMNIMLGYPETTGLL
jgi:N-acetyl-gamma-glutamyl-phosphate reductase